MKSIIREKRRVSFDKKRITPEIIRSFADIIEKEIKALTKKEAETIYIMYSVDATDNSSYESQSCEIFDEKKIIGVKAIQKVVMRFNTIDNSKNIEIQIVHSLKNNKSENFILISGDDHHWVNGVEKYFTEILIAIEPQPKYVNSFGYFIFFSWLIFIIYYFKVVSSEIARILNDWFKLFVIIGIPIISIILAFIVFEYLNSLWPAIELQTGPKHHQIPAKNRRRTIFWLSLIIVPVILEIIIDFFKSR